MHGIIGSIATKHESGRGAATVIDGAFATALCICFCSARVWRARQQHKSRLGTCRDVQGRALLGVAPVHHRAGAQQRLCVVRLVHRIAQGTQRVAGPAACRVPRRGQRCPYERDTRTRARRPVLAVCAQGDARARADGRARSRDKRKQREQTQTARAPLRGGASGRMRISRSAPAWCWATARCWGESPPRCCLA